MIIFKYSKINYSNFNLVLCLFTGIYFTFLDKTDIESSYPARSK